MPTNARTRLTSWHAVIFGLTIGAAAVFLHFWVSMALDRHHDDQLHEIADRIAASLKGAPLDRASVANIVRDSGAESRFTMVVVRNANGEVAYESQASKESVSAASIQPALLDLIKDRPADARFLRVALRESESARFVSVPSGGGDTYVQVGILLGDVGSWLHSIEFWSIFLIPGVVALTSFLFWRISGRLLDPSSQLR
jgi:hypothetical protein